MDISKFKTAHVTILNNDVQYTIYIDTDDDEILTSEINEENDRLYIFRLKYITASQYNSDIRQKLSNGWDKVEWENDYNKSFVQKFKVLLAQITIYRIESTIMKDCFKIFLDYAILNRINIDSAFYILNKAFKEFIMNEK